jgi:hypothetical protein
MAVSEKERNLEVQDECAYMYVYGKEEDIWKERQRERESEEKKLDLVTQCN